MIKLYSYLIEMDYNYVNSYYLLQLLFYINFFLLLQCFGSYSLDLLLNYCNCK